MAASVSTMAALLIASVALWLVASTGLRTAARRPDTWEAADMAQRLFSKPGAPPWPPSCATRACCCSSAHPCCAASSTLVLRRRGAHPRARGPWWTWTHWLSRQITRFADADPRIGCAWSPPASARRRRPQARRDRGLCAHPQPQAQRGARRKRRGQHRGQRRLCAAQQAVQYGLAEAVGTVSAGVEIRKLQASGQSALQAAPAAPRCSCRWWRDQPIGVWQLRHCPPWRCSSCSRRCSWGAALLAGTWVEAGEHRPGATT